MTSLLALLSLVIGEPAVATSVVGTVELDDGKTQTALVRFALVPEGSTVTTHANSRATLRIPDGSELRLGPDTRASLGVLVMRQPAANRTTRVKLWTGRIWAGVMGLFGNEAAFDVETENAVAGVRGTAFWTIKEQARTDFVTDYGSLKVQLGDQSRELVGPGAALSANDGRLGEPTLFDPAALRRLRGEVGGAGAALRGMLGSGRGPGGRRLAGGATPARPSDADVNPPDRLVDTPIATHDASELIRGVAQITVKVRLPNE
jgi:hypothetical protein